jgi:hypothetical protein
MISAIVEPAQAEKEMAKPSIYSPADVDWKDGPASLPSGAKLAVLVEHVTVIEGTFHLGMGETFDQSAGQTMPAGTFGHWPAGMKHFAWTTGETVIQLHGIGPWTINYVNPANDPRIKKN